MLFLGGNGLEEVEWPRGEGRRRDETRGKERRGEERRDMCDCYESTTSVECCGMPSSCLVSLRRCEDCDDLF